ncbi:hypothetical protein CSA37_09480 [Candidatus Fermentibacteria bacterium]|nr:MAG: hypothetical protein CSA37_09480 [Candidatus Fermentibacteria bacterium]
MEWVAVYGGEEDIEPAFFTADYFTVSGDSLFVSDDPGQRLVCLTLDGVLRWRAGGLGEGPGYFLGIGRAAVSGEIVAVCNNAACAIDLYSRNGEYLRRLSPVASPQDVEFLSDTSLIVFSKSEPGGDCHIMSIADGSIECSFGDGQWQIVERNRSPRDLNGIVSLERCRVAYISQFEHKLIIYDLDTHELIYRGARELPSATHPPADMIENDGTRRGLLFPVPGVVFEGPEGMVNITIPKYMNDGELLHDAGPYDFAPVTIVDRYDWDGMYLDSYCVPESILTDMYYSAEYGIIARQGGSEVIHRFQLTSQ